MNLLYIFDILGYDLRFTYNQSPKLKNLHWFFQKLNSFKIYNNFYLFFR